MSFDACAEMVARGDPDRFRAAMAAPLPGRGGLLALYAFNLELARAPFVTSEPMLAEMRVQWWADAVDEIFSDAEPRRHEVVTPLAETIRDRALPQAPFEALIEARRRDARADPVPDLATVEAYVADTGGGLAWLGASILGAGAAAEAFVRASGTGAGMAAWLAAVPDLLARGRAPLPPMPPEEAMRALAVHGLDQLDVARAGRRSVPKQCYPALLSGVGAAARLAQVRRAPMEALTAPVMQSEFRKRLGFAIAAISGPL